MNEGLAKVATGVWLYDGTVPHVVIVFAVPAGSDRWPDWHEEYDDRSEEDFRRELDILAANGFVYEVGFGPSADAITSMTGWFASIEEALAWVNGQPWGPVDWDQSKL